MPVVWLWWDIFRPLHGWDALNIKPGHWGLCSTPGELLGDACTAAIHQCCRGSLSSQMLRPEETSPCQSLSLPSGEGKLIMQAQVSLISLGDSVFTFVKWKDWIIQSPEIRPTVILSIYFIAVSVSSPASVPISPCFVCIISAAWDFKLLRTPHWRGIFQPSGLNDILLE